MSEAPERIWWNGAPLPYSYTSTVQFAGGVEYVRADRIEELETLIKDALAAGAISDKWAWVFEDAMTGGKDE